MILQLHCTQIVFKLQTAQAVKKIAWLPIPFANCDPLRLDKFERLYSRLSAIFSNGLNRVLHDFSLAILEVRKVGTSEHKTVIQCV
jgi:hypothetical protein